MQQLTAESERDVQNMAARYGVSVDAVKALLSAVLAGGGTMAQFSIPELGGGGQWMQGGMTMVGDMFNGRLQSTVSGLCSELSALLASRSVFVPTPARVPGAGPMASSNGWWPAELGQPSSSGGQNDSRYAYFPNVQRLAIERGGQLSIYNTLDHWIGGVQQQQGGTTGSLSFTSQFGTFTVDSLPLVSAGAQAAWQAQPPPPPFEEPLPAPFSAPSEPVATGPRGHEDILAAIERLGQLHQKGILSDDEFRSKKTELLSRL
jgi:hypothetical protein